MQEGVSLLGSRLVHTLANKSRCAEEPTYHYPTQLGYRFEIANMELNSHRPLPRIDQLSQLFRQTTTPIFKQSLRFHSFALRIETENFAVFVFAYVFLIHIIFATLDDGPSICELRASPIFPVVVILS